MGYRMRMLHHFVPVRSERNNNGTEKSGTIAFASSGVEGRRHIAKKDPKFPIYFSHRDWILSLRSDRPKCMMAPVMVCICLIPASLLNTELSISEAIRRAEGAGFQRRHAGSGIQVGWLGSRGRVDPSQPGQRDPRMESRI